jgi:hypothetical protein
MYFANKTPSNFLLWMRVNYDFPLNTNLISAKLGWEHSLLHGPAMSMELQLCLNKGQEVVKTIAKQVVIALVLVKWE